MKTAFVPSFSVFFPTSIETVATRECNLIHRKLINFEFHDWFQFLTNLSYLSLDKQILFCTLSIDWFLYSNRTFARFLILGLMAPSQTSPCFWKMFKKTINIYIWNYDQVISCLCSRDPTLVVPHQVKKQSLNT